LRNASDFFQNTSCVCQCIIVPEADDRDAFAGKPFRSFPISCRFLREVMLTAI